MFQNGVPVVMPAKAEPLLLAADVTAYSISEKPCGPPLRMPTGPWSKVTAAATPTLLRIPAGPSSNVTAAAMPTSSRIGVAST